MATLVTSPYVHSGLSPRKEPSRESDKTTPPVPRIAGPKGRMLSLVPNLELDVDTLRVRPRRPKPTGGEAQP